MSSVTLPAEFLDSEDQLIETVTLEDLILKNSAWTSAATLHLQQKDVRADILTHLPAFVLEKNPHMDLMRILETQKSNIAEIVEAQLGKVTQHLRDQFKVVILGRGSPYLTAQIGKRGQSEIVFQARKKVEDSVNMPGASVITNEYIHSFIPKNHRKSDPPEILQELAAGIQHWADYSRK